MSQAICDVCRTADVTKKTEFKEQYQKHIKENMQKDCLKKRLNYFLTTKNSYRFFLLTKCYPAPNIK